MWASQRLLVAIQGGQSVAPGLQKVDILLIIDRIDVFTAC